MKKNIKATLFVAIASAAAALVTYKVIECKKKKAEENNDVVQVDILIASTDTTSENNCDCTDDCTDTCDCECRDDCTCESDCTCGCVQETNTEKTQTAEIFDNNTKDENEKPEEVTKK